MTNEAKLRLNIGAGKSRIEGFHNIDISERADIVVDLAKEPLPFEESSVDLVFSYHTIEHVSDYLFAMSEIYRVLKDGGILLLGTPYVTLTEYNLVNPYHLNHFNEHSLSFFDPHRLRGSAEEDTPTYFHKIFHRFHYMGGFKAVPPPLRGWCRRHLFNVVSRIDFGAVAVKSPDTLDALPDRRALIEQFDHCKRSRKFYDEVIIGGSPSPIRRVARWWHGV